MPTVLSMCHGGIWRPPTRDAIDLAHGRASSYLASPIGAMPWARGHASHFDWKIGATSLVNVTVFVGSAARVTPATKRVAPTVKAHRPSQLVGLPYIVALLSKLARSGQSNLARSKQSNLARSMRSKPR